MAFIYSYIEKRLYCFIPGIVQACLCSRQAKIKIIVINEYDKENIKTDK